MKLAITGGAGFLGYHLCSKLSDRYDKIFVLDIAPVDPKEYPKNAVYVNADVRNAEQLNGIFKEVDVVIHASAALPLWKRRDILEVNVKGTENVLEAAKNNNIQRVIFVSSTAVYGIPKKHPIYEDDLLVGVGPYGESKIAAEAICERYRKEGMCIPVVRPKSFIGTGRLGVFQILYDWVENGKKIPIIGNGRNHYQLLEVEDLVEFIFILLTTSPEKANDVFNIGAESFKTVKEDVSALCDYAGTGTRVLPIPAWVVIPALCLFEKLKLSPLYKWVYGTAATDSFVSIDKIRNKFGWFPKYSNAQTLIRSYAWYLEHKGELSGTGVTHRVAWDQGILAIAKKFL